MYRGLANPRMQGIYFYGDLCTGEIWGLKRDGAAWQVALLYDSSLVITTFGEDESGGLYVADYVTGAIYLISDAPSTAPTSWWFPWYDDAGMQTSVLVGNPSSSQTTTCTVFIGLAGGSLVQRGTHALAPNDTAAHETAGLINGPVKVQCDKLALSSEQAFYSSSFNEVMGIPEAQRDREWWFPWYDNVGMRTWVLIGNPANAQTVRCVVFIGGTQRSTPSLSPNSVAALFFDGLIGGPVKVQCDLPVFASERAVYSSSFNEVMGTPAAALSPTQWFPWYDNVYMRTWLLIGNPSSSQTAICHVYIGIVGGNLALRGTYSIAPNSVAIPLFDGLIDGPVKVDCDLPVFASERSIYQSSFNEVAGTAPGAFSLSQWFPWYDNVGMTMWILIGNPFSTQTANCTVFIANTPRSTHSIPPNSLTIPQYDGVADGPVQIQCDIPVYVSERAVYQGSFNEVMSVRPE